MSLKKEEKMQEVQQPEVEEWLDLETLASVELTTEDDNFPIDLALIPGEGPGWRAALPGKQTIRILFDRPQHLNRIRLVCEEAAQARTQEFVLFWLATPDGPSHEIVRQQYNFSPTGSTREVEDYTVTLKDVRVIELHIQPDISGEPAWASLTELRFA